MIFLFVVSTLHVTLFVSLLSHVTVPSPSYVYVTSPFVPNVNALVVSPTVIVAFF